MRGHLRERWRWVVCFSILRRFRGDSVAGGRLGGGSVHGGRDATGSGRGAVPDAVDAEPASRMLWRPLLVFAAPTRPRGPLARRRADSKGRGRAPLVELVRRREDVW